MKTKDKKLYKSNYFFRFQKPKKDGLKHLV